MGFFTFTDAARPESKIKYGRRMVYVRPDDTHVVEDSYDGYGMVGGNDVFVMLFEQNADEAATVIDIMLKSDKCALDPRFASILCMYAQNPGQERLREKLEDLGRNYEYENDFTNTGWKRLVGISMMQENDRLPFPMKVTEKLRHGPYSGLLPSASTQ